MGEGVFFCLFNQSGGTRCTLRCGSVLHALGLELWLFVIQVHFAVSYLWQMYVSSVHIGTSVYREKLTKKMKQMDMHDVKSYDDSIADQS